MLLERQGTARPPSYSPNSQNYALDAAANEEFIREVCIIKSPSVMGGL